jgi:hypothetical protein
MDIGAWDEGIALVKRAMALNPDPPSWYFIPQGYNAYRAAHYDEALNWADRMNLPDFFLYHTLRIASYMRLGDTDRLNAEITALGNAGYADANLVSVLLKERSRNNDMWEDLRHDIEKAFHANLRS